MILRLLTAGLLTVLLLTGCTGSEPIPTATSPGDDLAKERKAAGIADCPTAGPVKQPAGGLPDVTLECLGGGSSTSLAALPQGRPMLVNVWAQWCGPCRKEAPHLAAVHKKLGSKIAFIGIDSNDPRPELAIAFAQEAGWTWPQLVDPDWSLRGKLGVGMPHTVLVDAEGHIVAQHPGEFTSAAELEQLIATKLKVRA